MTQDLLLSHWKLTQDESGLLWITLDRQGERTNTLSEAVMAEMKTWLKHVEKAPPRAIIIRSGKTSGFIAGADVTEFESMATPERGEELVARGWHLFNRLEGLSCPTLALIQGHCLGGGLELALACRFRIAVDQPDTRLGLPEVQLGIVPAWGGMMRLPRRIGPSRALSMMLSGKTVDARGALALGLVDACVPARVMEQAAKTRVLDPAPAMSPGVVQRLLNGPFKFLVARSALRQLRRKVRQAHYPAPYVLLKTWQEADGNALALPALLHDLLEAPATRHLIRVFHLQERLKAFGKGRVFDVRRVHVVGAGVMGGDIATWCVTRGLRVTLQDQALDRIAQAVQRADDAFRRHFKADHALQAARDRLIPDLEGSGACHADVIIEAIYEDPDAKRKLLGSLEQRAKPGALLATNTSSLSLEELARNLKDPSRFVGLHFFNPVARMPLVEIISGSGTGEEAHGQACAFVLAMGKLPLPVRDAPGFFVNAILAPYMREALRCLDEGIAPAALDEALEAAGMPMGPVELMDTVGLDIVLAAGRHILHEPPSPGLVVLLGRNHLGKKSGQGFYEWKDGRAIKSSFGAVPPGLADRLLDALTDRAFQLVRDGVVQDGDLADAGAIFGAGFAPFTGGPLHRRMASQHHE